MQDIYNNISYINNEINEISKKNSEVQRKVKLIAVSKTFGIECIEKAYEAGARDFGENKVQELIEKFDYFSEKYNDIKWHLIGHLQTNKVKKIIGKTSLIHSVDSIKLAEEINKHSFEKGIITNILIEVKISNEETKYGIPKEDVIGVMNSLSELNNIYIKGLMTIAEKTTDINLIRNNFKQVKQLYDEISELNIPNAKFEYLSMGMSNDYKIAIEEGSNMVRVGSGIFGKRTYNLV
jgi:pyridoxal phosphate enzyme (YggS family)